MLKLFSSLALAGLMVSALPAAAQAPKFRYDPIERTAQPGVIELPSVPPARLIESFGCARMAR